jgi:hypothetical protein
LAQKWFFQQSLLASGKKRIFSERKRVPSAARGPRGKSAAGAEIFAENLEQEARNFPLGNRAAATSGEIRTRNESEFRNEHVENSARERVGRSPDATIFSGRDVFGRNL